MDAAMERYTDLPLPPYAFLPGVDPHPTTDVAGHSYQRSRLMPGWQPPEAWATCPAYLQGCDLFNHGYFWEAHEAWEELWLSCDRSSVQAHYLQGLIQAANALLKRRMQRPRAVERLRRAALCHLASVPNDYMGLAVRSWSNQLDNHLRTPSRDFPRLVLGHDDPPDRSAGSPRTNL